MSKAKKKKYIQIYVQVAICLTAS